MNNPPTTPKPADSEQPSPKGLDETICSPLNAGPQMQWRIHTANLLSEIANNDDCWVLRQPLRIFGRTLAEVGERAAELNDPKLNALMCRLTIYTCADPKSPDYDPELTARVLSEENR